MHFLPQQEILCAASHALASATDTHLQQLNATSAAVVAVLVVAADATVATAGYWATLAACF